ncbi:hypothetical protein ACF053_25000 [Streptomyces kanasensis]|uniref:hypothetical protein n=1 Tax=Streptomyces kanasensis TaxID=936756 RepID=UPI003702E33F
MSPGGQVRFHAACGHLVAAPAERTGRDVRCPHCERVVRVPDDDVPYASPVPGQGFGGGPVPGPVPGSGGGVEPFALTAVYVAALLVGLAGAGVVHLVMFDALSESELVTLSPLWFFPVVFGLYGFVSQRLLRRIAQGRAASLVEAARLSIDVAGYGAALVLFPFLVLRLRSSLLVSLAAAAFWAVLLWLFFALLFPTL